MQKHKENNWYIGLGDVVVDDVRECECHPTMSNARVLRTLKSVKSFSLEPAGYVHPNCKIRPITHENGLVHKRVVLSILFDYEKPFLELLIEQGCLKEHEGVNEKLNCIPEIKDTVTEIKTKIDIFLQENGK